MQTITPQLPRLFQVPESLKDQLKTGAYRLSFYPNELFAEDRVLRGTLRVVREDAMASASADLYGTPKNRPWGDGIPVFHVNEYRGYARVIGIEDTSQATSEVSGQAKQTFNIEIDYYLFDHSLKCWNPFGKLKLEFTKGESEFESEVKKEGERLGRLSWQVDRLNGDFVRKATVVIHGSDSCNMPGGVKPEERKEKWQDGFKEALWQIAVEEKGKELNEEEQELRDRAKGDEPAPSWKENDLRERLDRAACASAKELNAWYYHLFCVSKIEEGYLGLMFDPGANDSRDLPREGAAIAAKVEVKLKDTDKPIAYQEFKDLYFRTAVHEIGHAMGLRHGDDGIMAETGIDVAADVNKFSKFSEGDRNRLIHMPDICVRPGGIPFGFEYTKSRIGFHETTYRSRGFSLNVSPLHSIVPLGAPVRLEIQMVADTGYGLPRDIRLGSGFVHGEVIDPKGVPRTFASIMSCSEKNCALNSSGCTDPGWSAKEDGNQRLSGLTLLRGPEGFLFPESGQYRIRVFVEWRDGGKLQSASAETYIFIKAIDLADEKHASLVTEVLRTPELLYSIALPGTPHDLLNRLTQDSELGAHYGYIAAQSKFPERYDDAIAILNRGAVLTERERHHVLRSIEEKLEKERRMDYETSRLLDTLITREVKAGTMKTRIEKLIAEKTISFADVEK